MRSKTIMWHHQVAQTQCQQELVTELSPLNDAVGCELGMLIFSHQKKLLYADRRALELLGRPEQPECEPAFEIQVAPVCEFRDTIQAAMDHRRVAGMWEPFELKRVFFEPARKIVARGFGLVDRNSHDSCIVITLEEVHRRQERGESQWLALGSSQDRGAMAIRGSAKLGSAHGVFDVSMHEVPRSCTCQKLRRQWV